MHIEHQQKGTDEMVQRDIEGWNDANKRKDNDKLIMLNQGRN